MTLATSNTLAQHIRDLAAAFKIHLQEVPEMPPDLGISGQLVSQRPFHERDSAIIIAPVTDETTYAVALHEIGHCLHPLGRVHHIQGSTRFRRTGQYSTLEDVRLLLLAERSAWEWARQHALEWTPVMDYVEQLSTDSYVKLGRRFGLRRTT